MPTTPFAPFLILAAGTLVTACAAPTGPGAAPREAVARGAVRQPAGWPSTLRVVDDGYPKPGDPCRSLGETAVVMDYLDHTERLVGCPTFADAKRIGADIILTEGGITVGSVVSLGP